MCILGGGEDWGWGAGSETAEQQLSYGQMHCWPRSSDFSNNSLECGSVPMFDFGGQFCYLFSTIEVMVTTINQTEPLAVTSHGNWEAGCFYDPSGVKE